MSLARGLTKRIKRTQSDQTNTPSPPTRARSQSLKGLGLQIDRAKISAPVALVSTTNMLSYNAPDIVPLQTPTSSKASTHSADDSDHSISTRSRASSHASRDTLTDASSVASSPTSPAPNHLSGYFAAANKNIRRSLSSGNLQSLKETKRERPPVPPVPEIPDVPSVPAIPERALSHSKRAHERLAHKRSMQHMSRHSSTLSSRELRTSIDMFSGSEENPHPFGKELEQLNEVAEEFNGAVRDAELEADLALIHERHLAMFCAADYMAEIQPLFSSRFGTFQSTAPLAWI